MGRLSQLGILSVVLAAAAIACNGDSGASPTAGSPTPNSALNVVTTIYPVTYFAQRIGGERVDVQSLVKPGVEAHDFEPTPGDIRTISGADVLLYVAPSFEAWVADAVESVDDGPVAVNTADLVDNDPHVWLDPARAAEQVRRINESFSTADPAGAAVYETNSEALTAELLELGRLFSQSLNSCVLGHIVVSHEAYGHLAQRYGIEQIGLADLSAEFESTPQRVAEVIKEMERLGTSHILQEPILSDDLAKTVADETGAVLLPLHPLESLTTEQLEGGETYFSVMRQNLESLETALQCG